MFNNFSENCAFYGAVWKSTVQPNKPPVTIKYGACAVRAGTDTLKYTSCFYTATVVTRTRLNVTLCVHCLSCLFLRQTKS